MNPRLARWYLLRAAMAAKARRERRRRRREVILLVIKILGEPAPDVRGRGKPGFSDN
jgi:hypothetical protein